LLFETDERIKTRCGHESPARGAGRGPYPRTDPRS
jgi:hypothetical protein